MIWIWMVKYNILVLIELISIFIHPYIIPPLTDNIDLFGEVIHPLTDPIGKLHISCSHSNDGITKR